MQLKGENGMSVELEITGYQHPGITDDYWLSNWLIVRVAVEHPRGAWSSSHPCLTTFELDQLARWFEGLAAIDPDPKAGHFTEPNLTFSYLPPPVAAIQLRLAYETAPPWVVDRNQRLDGIVLSFPLAPNDPRACAQSLRMWLARFPQRGRRDSR